MSTATRTPWRDRWMPRGPFGDAPVQPDQEWANALTHAAATAAAIIAAAVLVRAAAAVSPGAAFAAAAYMATVIGTFVASTLSHTYLRQPTLDTLRAWDQAMIYLMIVGTYTPIIHRYAPPPAGGMTIAAMWTAAGIGFAEKVVRRQNVNAISPWPYLALGWAPAAVMVATTPTWVVGVMLLGGLFYSAGVYFLMNDARRRYYHAAWHLCVMTASAVQWGGIRAMY